MALKLQNCVRLGYLNSKQANMVFKLRYKHTAAIPLDEAAGVCQIRKHNQKQNLHISAAKCYPAAPALPLPGNMMEIFGNETGRFTPERARDINGPVIHQSSVPAHNGRNESQGYNFGSYNAQLIREDSHVDSYDCTGSVSLNGSMQSNVPTPFCSAGKSMHLNMPGGQWSRDSKYIAEDMQNSHYAKIKLRHPKQKYEKGNQMYHSGAGANISTSSLLKTSLCPRYISTMGYSTDSGPAPNEPKKSANGPTKVTVQSSADKLKKAVKDYGSTVIVFHVAISLTSLGACYLAVSSGLDIASLIETVGFGGGTKLESLLTNSSTFVVAYAVHKLFAPVRISITLGATPFLVRYLRNVGILKAPKV